MWPDSHAGLLRPYHPWFPPTGTCIIIFDVVLGCPLGESGKHLQEKAIHYTV